MEKVLYKAESEMKNFPEGNRVFILFRENADDIKYPLEVYHKFIRNFDLLDDKEKAYTKHAVNELFTREEIEEMRPYFGPYLDGQPRSQEVRAKAIRPDTVPWAKKPVGKNCYFEKFSQRADYKLQVKVWGYCKVDM